MVLNQVVWIVTAYNYKFNNITQTIDIESIVTMMRMLPKQYDTEAIKVAKGKNKLMIDIVYKINLEL